MRRGGRINRVACGCLPVNRRKARTPSSVGPISIRTLSRKYTAMYFCGRDRTRDVCGIPGPTNSKSPGSRKASSFPTRLVDLDSTVILISQ